MKLSAVLSSAYSLCLLAAVTVPVNAQCPEKPALQNSTGTTSVACPCFAVGEQAGVVLTAPAADYPIEILRVGIAWGSVFGGAPASLEEAIHIYPAGLPNPGVAQFSLLGPNMTDGFLNEFNLSATPGNKTVNSGAFTIALEFANENAGNFDAPSVVHDGNGCQAGKNVIFATPGGWLSACAAGVTGDWVMYAVYRKVCGTDVGEGVLSSAPIFLAAPRPNPSRSRTEVEFILDHETHVRVRVSDVAGRTVAILTDQVYASGRHAVSWDRGANGGSNQPSGIYFVTLEADGLKQARRLIVAN